MSHSDHHASPSGDDTIVSLLSRFFPGTSEKLAFVGGILVGLAILGVLGVIAFSINGHLGLWRTF